MLYDPCRTGSNGSLSAHLTTASTLLISVWPGRTSGFLLLCNGTAIPYVDSGVRQRPTRSIRAQRWKESGGSSASANRDDDQNSTTRADGLIRCVVLNRVGAFLADEVKRLVAALWDRGPTPGILAAGTFVLPLRFLFGLPEPEPKPPRSYLSKRSERGNFRGFRLVSSTVNGVGTQVSAPQTTC